MQHLLLACDKFKNCLSSQEVNAQLAIGLSARARSLGIPLKLSAYRVSDGGEGFLEMVAQKDVQYQKRTLTITNPQGQKQKAPWVYHQPSGAAFLECATLIGHQLITERPLRPLHYSSRGLGEALLQLAQQPEVQHIYVGLGSTATVDGGFGALSALGANYINAQGQSLAPDLPNLPDLYAISPPSTQLPSLTLIADVKNPWLGPRGGLQVYGPQKGLQPHEIQNLTQHMDSIWLPLLQRHGHTELPLKALAHGGAAGGVGLALSCFYKVQWEEGANWCIQHLKLEEKISQASGIITGEGCLDASSYEGKITGTLMTLAQTYGKAMRGVFGQVLPELASPLFYQRSPYQGASHAQQANREETKDWLVKTGQVLLDTFEYLF